MNTPLFITSEEGRPDCSKPKRREHSGPCACKFASIQPYPTTPSQAIRHPFGLSIFGSRLEELPLNIVARASSICYRAAHVNGLQIPRTPTPETGRRGVWPSPPALEAGDRWFESSRPDHHTNDDALGFCRRSSEVEHPPCKRQVEGSNPLRWHHSP